MNRSAKSASRRRLHRRGAVLVEMAITAPILFGFFGFLWEFSRAEMIRHTVSTAAYEGAREALVAGATSEEATAAAQEVLDAVGVRNASITVTPSTITPQTETIQVTITVPLNSNAVITPFFMNGLQINAEMTLKR
jgi:Flp pilus assembly protein TadG